MTKRINIARISAAAVIVSAFVLLISRSVAANGGLANAMAFNPCRNCPAAKAASGFENHGASGASVLKISGPPPCWMAAFLKLCIGCGACRLQGGGKSF